SHHFKQWLSRTFYTEHKKAASANAVTHVVNLLEAQAQFDGVAQEVFVRVAQHGKNLYVDLGDSTWQAIEITATGWRIMLEPPVKFRRPSGMKALPRPVEGGNLKRLRRFANLGSDDDWLLVQAWLGAAFRATGPYPVLVLSGGYGRAKSTLERVLRAVIDPNVAPVRAQPHSVQDLMISATNCWVLAFDNV